MQRVLVVPWSIAAAYFAMVRSPRSGAGEEGLVGQGAEGAADQRPDDRDPGVAPVGRSLAGDREDRVHDARAEVARGVDRVPRRTAEREADAEHQQADDQPTQLRGPEVLVVVEGIDREDQQERAD